MLPLIADKHGHLDPWLSHQIYYFIIIVIPDSAVGFYHPRKD